jgi:hypothetical protein
VFALNPLEHFLEVIIVTCCDVFAICTYFLNEVKVNLGYFLSMYMSVVTAKVLTYFDKVWYW